MKMEDEQQLVMDRNLSDIEMDADDLEGDLNLSDCEDGDQKRGMLKLEKAQKRAKRKTAPKKK